MKSLCYGAIIAAALFSAVFSATDQTVYGILSPLGHNQVTVSCYRLNGVLVFPEFLVSTVLLVETAETEQKEIEENLETVKRGKRVTWE
jgi:hypothetical protein